MKIEFAKSGKTVEWDDKYESIVELAEANGVEIDAPCRTGACGICKTKLISGKVAMENEDGLDDADKADNMILPCVAVPETDIVLDA